MCNLAKQNGKRWPSGEMSPGRLVWIRPREPETQLVLAWRAFGVSYRFMRQLLVRGREARQKGSFDRTQSRAFAQIRGYGVVPKGLLTFPDSLYKEVAKTTSRTLVYRFERQTARKNISSFEKHCVLDLECRILSQESSDGFILYYNVIFHGK